MKNKIYLFLYFLFSILLYLNFPLVEFFFLVPIFYYLKNNKNINFIHLSLIITLISIGNYIYFYEFGLKYLIYIIIANLFLFLPFFYLSKIFINLKYSTILIPSAFYIIFYLLGLSIFNNFWTNLIGFLEYFPISITYIGSYGNLFLLILFNIIIFELLNIKNFKLAKIKNKITILILIFLIFNFFIFNTYFFPKENKGLETINIVGISANLNQSWSQRFNNTDKNLNKYLKLSSKAVKKYNPQIIIWPEYTFTNLLEVDFKSKNKLINFSKKNNLTLITGSLILKNFSSSNSKYYDTLFIFQNNLINLYKAYKPIKIFDSMVLSAKNNSKIKHNNISIGLFLCYEENFVNLFTNSINKDNSNLFIVSGNLYYIKNKHGQELISFNSRLRAAENNRFLVRVENGGINQIVDNNGLVLKKLNYDKINILNYKVPIILDKTFYSIYQKYLDLLILIISVLIIFLNIKSEKNKKEEKN